MMLQTKYRITGALVIGLLLIATLPWIFDASGYRERMQDTQGRGILYEQRFEEDTNQLGLPTYSKKNPPGKETLVVPFTEDISAQTSEKNKNVVLETSLSTTSLSSSKGTTPHFDAAKNKSTPKNPKEKTPNPRADKLDTMLAKASASDRKWIVQIGVFAVEAYAIEEKNRLQRLGFGKAKVKRHLTKEHNNLRVFLGPYPTEQKARNIVSLLSKKGLKALVKPQNPKHTP